MAADLSRKELEAFADAEARRQGVPPQLVKAMIDVESNWEPAARSGAGATGLMQLMGPAAKEVGVRDRTNPVENIRGGVTYLKKQLNRFGDIGLALAAYNWGPGRAAKLEANPRGTRIADETLKYVPEVFARMRRYGQMLQPSTITMALFPAIAGVLENETVTSLRGKTGAATREQIAQDIRTGNVPQPSAAPQGPVAEALPPQLPPEPLGPEPAGLPPAAAAPAGTDLATEAAPGTEVAALPEARPAAAPSPGAQNPRSIDAFLRAQFGPLADIADPFPDDYDDELMRLIARA
jgi:hypothetical protein